MSVLQIAIGDPEESESIKHFRWKDIPYADGIDDLGERVLWTPSAWLVWQDGEWWVFENQYQAPHYRGTGFRIEILATAWEQARLAPDHGL